MGMIPERAHGSTEGADSGEPFVGSGDWVPRQIPGEVGRGMARLQAKSLHRFVAGELVCGRIESKTKRQRHPAGHPHQGMVGAERFDLCFRGFNEIDVVDRDGGSLPGTSMFPGAG